MHQTPSSPALISKVRLDTPLALRTHQLIPSSKETAADPYRNV